MTILHSVTLSAAFLKHDDFVVLQVFQNLRFNRGAFYNRCTYLNLTVIVCKQDFVEAHRRVNLARKTVNIELATLFSLKLLTCNFYYYVHLISLLIMC